MSHGEVYSKPTDAADYVCMETYERVVRERDEARRALRLAVAEGSIHSAEYLLDEAREQFNHEAAAELGREKKGEQGHGTDTGTV